MFLGRGPFATSSPPCHLLFTPSLWRCHILLHLYVQFQGITWWNAPFCLSLFFLSFFIFFFSSPAFLEDKCFYWCASVCPYVCLSLSAPLPVSISQCFSSSFIVSFYLSCSLSFCLSVCLLWRRRRGRALVCEWWMETGKRRSWHHKVITVGQTHQDPCHPLPEQASVLQLRHDQKQHIKDPLDAQAEDRQMFQDLIQQAGETAVAPEATGAEPHTVLTKMGLQDDLEIFLELYKFSVLVWGWAVEQ